MTGCITGISADSDDTAGIQPAGISGYGAVSEDFRIGKAHRAEALTGIVYFKMQGLAVFIPERSANIMLTAGVNVKLCFAVYNRCLNFQQQVFGGHTLMADKCIYAKHCFLSLPVSMRTGCQADRQ